VLRTPLEADDDGDGLSIPQARGGSAHPQAQRASPAMA